MCTPRWPARGDDCGPELVRDLMRQLGLVPCQPRPWRPTTTQPGDGADVVPDLVGRDFTRLGVRLPMGMVSAHIAPNTVINTCHDHTSFLKTMFENGAATSPDH